MKLVFASNNAHKLAEVRKIMPEGIEVLSLNDIGFDQEIEETGTTLEENSRIKAATVFHWILDNGQWTIDGIFADDTGLEIDALDGKPGVYTARWYHMDNGQWTMDNGQLSEREIFAANRKKALTELADKEDRGAQFRTVITLLLMNGDAALNGENDGSLQVEGIVRGRIATEEYGEGGFGYDPIFIPEGYDKTFGELPAELKNTISHRARALHALVNIL